MNNYKITAILIFTVSLFQTSLWSQNTQYCDSLIKRGIDLMWKKEHEKSLEILIKAKNTAEKNKWYQHYFTASNNIGGNYYLMLDYGEALNQYLESYSTAIAHLDESFEMIVLNNIAILYSKEKKFDKAYDYFLKAYTIAKKRNNKVKIGYYAVNLASVLNETGKPLEVQKYLSEANTYLKNHPDILYLSHVVQAENELLLGKTVQSRNNAIALLKDQKNKFSADNQIVLHLLIAKSYLKENELTGASEWSKKALSQNPDPEKKIEIFRLLSDINRKLKNYERALVYKDSVFNAQDQLNEIKNGQLFESSQIKFQLQDYKKEITVKDSKIRSDRFIFFSILGIVLLFLIFVLITYRNQTIKNRQTQLIAQRNQEITLLKLQKETDDKILSNKKEKIAVLEQERLEKEIELRNQKIAAKALYISGKDQLLLEIMNSLGKIPELHQNKAVSNHIKQLKKHLSIDTEWESFMVHFEEVNHGLLHKLKAKHPDLTQNDLRFISYEYMNLSTKEIATLLNITPDACRKRKERVVSKLDVAEPLHLSDYLSTL